MLLHKCPWRLRAGRLLLARLGGGVISPSVRRQHAATKNQPSEFESMTAAALNSFIETRHEEGQLPPTQALVALCRSAIASGVTSDATLALAAHKRHVNAQRLIGVDNIRTLVMACVSGKDWDSLEDALVNSRRLQLFFPDGVELAAAIQGLAAAEEWERLERIHCALPRMAVDQVKTAKIHYLTVRALAQAQEVDAADRALAAAISMVDPRGTDSPNGPTGAHKMRLATLAPLLEAYVETENAAGAGQALHRACDLLELGAIDTSDDAWDVPVVPVQATADPAEPMPAELAELGCNEVRGFSRACLSHPISLSHLVFAPSLPSDHHSDPTPVLVGRVSGPTRHLAFV